MLVSLADQANDHGVCWPSIASLVRRTSLSERTVQRALRELEQAGFLRVETGAMKANRYTINVEAVKLLIASQAPPPPSPCHPRHGDTPVTVTPRGVMVTPGGCHGDTLTIIEPNTLSPLPPPGAEGPSVEGVPRVEAQGQLEGIPEVKAKGKAREASTLAQFLDDCRRLGVVAIPPDDAVFAYAAKVGLPEAFIALHWSVFKRKRLANRKTQKDWRATFRDSVEGNWYRLWLIQAGGDYVLTTQGQQAQRLLEAEADLAERHGAEAANDAEGEVCTATS